jgi:NADH-quinone oxidoreductase subunit H
MIEKKEHHYNYEWVSYLNFEEASENKYTWFLWLLDWVETIIGNLLKIIFILIGVAYFTLAERKVMASIQRRRGPNVVGFSGLLQPLADGFKLICKEMILPTHSNIQIFIFAPILILMLSLTSWSVIPLALNEETTLSSIMPITWVWSVDGFIFFIKSLSFDPSRWVNTGWNANISYGILFIMAISSLNVYGIIIAGWASNSKYAFLGSLRSAAQMISYEVSIGLVILPVILLSGSLNFLDIIISQSKNGWFVFPLLPSAIIFFISMIAETNRAPFDLPEAEAELVAGYNVEYSSIIFAMFFLGEYSNMLLMSTIIVILFFGGWLPPLYMLGFIPPMIWISFKVIIFCFLFILVRATLPRYRYDQLMEIGWKIFLPITLGYLIFISGTLLSFHGLPKIFEISINCYTENFFFL